MRKVMIGTPSYDGRVDVRYVDSLMGTLRAVEPETIIFPVFIPGDALVQRARNSLVKMALEAFDGEGVDELMFIDSDISWNPTDFYRLLSHKADIIGGLYPQKSDIQTVTIKLLPDKKVDEAGLLEVSGVGCGFLRMSKKALKTLWEYAKPYRNGPEYAKAIFEVSIQNEELFGEDTDMCLKWRSLGEKVYADTKILCAHTGTKVYMLGVKPVEPKPEEKKKPVKKKKKEG